MVAVAMSGGVDSSVAALRVARAGLSCFGITLAMWPSDREVVRDRGCCSIDAVDDARRIAAGLGMDHYVWNLKRDFEELVVAEFEAEYAEGRTPNPCVRCNERVKFGVLLQRALAAGATHLATGHYARTGKTGSEPTLHRAADRRRDQSYVLHRLDAFQVSRAVFPVGGVTDKASVRREAQAAGLGTAAKPESQDLCFVEGSLAAHLGRRLAGRFEPGPIVDTAGREVGRHRGLPFLTVGQRSGLGLRPVSANTAPSYVIELRPRDNTVVVGPREALGTSGIEVERCNWISGRPPAMSSICSVQLRAHGDPVLASLRDVTESSVHLKLEAEAFQVAPGQAAVLYLGDRVLGGGVVARTV